MCIFFVDVIYLSAAEIINSKLKYMYVLLIWFSPLEEGGKTGPEFPYICIAKAEKREFVEAQS